MSALSEKQFDGHRFITARQAAAVSKLNRDHITRLCRTQKIEARLIDNAWYVSEDGLHKFLLEQDGRKAQEASTLRKERKHAYHEKASAGPFLLLRSAAPRPFAVFAAVAIALLCTGTAALAFSGPHSLMRVSDEFHSLDHIALRSLSSLLPSSGENIAASAGAQQSAGIVQSQSSQTPATGTPPYIGNTDTPRPDFSTGGTLQVNTPLQAEKSLTVGGVGAFQNFLSAAQLSVSGSLNVGGSADIAGLLSASGGMVTNGADVNLGTGRLFASNVVNGVEAGTNVTITGPSNNPTISVTLPKQQQQQVFFGGGGGGNGTVTSVAAGDGLSGGTITKTGTLSLDLSHANTWSALQKFASGVSVDSGALVVSGNRVGVGTSSPYAQLALQTNASSTASALFALASAVGTSTRTIFSISSSGTTTASNGMDISSGCFAVNGSCISSGSNFVGGGSAGNIAYYKSNGNAIEATSSISISENGNVGVGTTSPYAPFAVAGEAVARFFTAASSSTESTFPLLSASRATTTHLAVASATSTLLKTNALGQVIAAVAGVDYATQSSIGSAIASTSAWKILDGALTPTTTMGILVNASSTIGNGTRGLTISGNATTTGNVYIAGRTNLSNILTLNNATSCNGTKALQTDANGNVSCGAIASLGISTAGGWSTDKIGDVLLATSTDRVGIGATTTPFAKLTVISGSRATTTLALVPNLGQTANIIDIFNTAGSLSSVLTASGRLGLGTTSPSQTLSVQGNGLFSGNVTLGNLTVAATSSFNGAVVLNGATTTAQEGINLTNGCFSIHGACLSAAGLGGLTYVHADYPLQGSGTSGSHLSLAFGTTTPNVWSKLQTFAGGFFSSASSTIGGGTQAGGLTVHGGATTTGNVYVEGTTTLAGALALNGTATTTAKNSINLLGGCFAINGTCVVGASGVGTITGLGPTGQKVTSGSATFATSTTATTGLTTGLTVTGSGSTLTFAPSLSGTLNVAHGGTGTSTGGVTNGVEYYNGTTLTNNRNFVFAGANLGISSSTPGSLLSVGNTNGINFSTGTSTFNSTGGIHLTHGCLELPDGGCAISSSNAGVTSVKQSYGVNQTGSLTLATSTLGKDFSITNSGSTFTFNLPSASATSRGLLTGAAYTAFNNKVSSTSLSATAPLSYNSSTGNFTIAQANGTTNGYLSSTDWSKFNDKVSSSSLSAYDTFGYLFPGNATTTKLTFTGGLLSLASTTIGNGTQAGGLTVNGGATTTGNLYVKGTSILTGTTTLAGVLTLNGATTTAAKGFNITGGCYAKNGACITASSLGGLSGTGSANELAYFSNSNTLGGNANLTYANSHLGVGTSSPYASLTAAGPGTLLAAVNSASKNVFEVGQKGATTTALAISGIAGSGTQCLEVNAEGQIIATGAACGGTGGPGTGIINLGPQGQLQNGATQTLASTTSTFNGLTSGITITASGNTQTFKPTLSGVLGVGGGGTGSTTLTGLLVGNGTGSLKSATISAPLSFSGSTLSISQANASQNGYLSSTDWTKFNDKVSSSSLSAYDTFGYLFPGNATSTKLTFSGGLLSLASTTIGNGTQAGGLTVNGGATTTGNLYVKGTSILTGTTTLAGVLTLNGATTTAAHGIHITSGCLELPDGGCAISSSNAGVTSVKQSYGVNQTGSLTLATSTLGKDFSITNSGSTFTFNLPSASATSRGLLTGAAYTAFNNKVSSTSLSATFPLAYNSSTGNFSYLGLGTSTNPTKGALPYWTGGNTLGSIATSAPTLRLGLTYSGTLGSLVGGTSGALSVATSSLYTGSRGQVAYFSGANTLMGTSSLLFATNGDASFAGDAILNNNFGIYAHNTSGSGTTKLLSLSSASTTIIGGGGGGPQASCGFGTYNASSSMCVGFITTTGNSSWTVPNDWNSSDNTIEVLGAGAAGDNGTSGTGGKGGKGGDYAKISNLALTSGDSIVAQVGAAGVGNGGTGGDTWFNGAALPSSSVGASGGGSGSSDVGTVTYSGGAGGSVSSTGGSGGGGAAGPNGNGVNGQNTNTPTGGTGGAGDNSSGGSGGAGSASGNGQAGGAGTEWSSSYGAGGGGGGGGAGFGGNTNGGAGGKYGSGGGGGSDLSGAGGNGAQGLIVISYKRNAVTEPTIEFQKKSGVALMDLFESGNVGISTTSPGSLLSIGSTNGINFSTGTSTFSSTGGINLKHGCFAVNGTCLGGGSGIVTHLGTGYGTTSAQDIIFSTSTDATTGLTDALAITASAGGLSFAPSLSGVLNAAHGGTGSTTLTGLLAGNGAGSIKSATISGPLSFSSNTLSISQANISTNGYLSSGDYARFNGKLGSTTIASLTNNYLPKWDSTSHALTDSLVYDDGTNAGIGTTSPFAKLSINASGSTDPAFFVGSSTAPYFLVSSSGRSSIATTSSQAELTIQSDVYGPELITNGDFNGNANGWTLSNSCVSYSAGAVTDTYNGSSCTFNDTLSTSISLVVGKTYVLSYDITNLSGVFNPPQGPEIYDAAGDLFNKTFGAGGHNVGFVTAVRTGTTTLTFDSSFSSWTIDNISLKEVVPSLEAYAVDGTSLLSSFGDTARENVGVGYGSLSATTTGNQNTAFGVDGLAYNTSGTSNVANGFEALKSNTSGNYNSAIGTQALQGNTTGSGNTASGYSALHNNLSGNYNVANGDDALLQNQTGSYNVANGYTALNNNESGSYNVANGYSVFSSNDSGSYNVGEGYYAGKTLTVGTSTTLIGSFSDVSKNNLSTSTAIGAGAVVGESNALVLGGTGKNAVEIGIGTSTPKAALDITNLFGTSSPALILRDSLGNDSFEIRAGTSTLGNTAIGVGALKVNTTGQGNVANGQYALLKNTQGSYNVANGQDALVWNETGSYNVANGAGALDDNKTGSSNVAAGNSALGGGTRGSGNTANGQSALYYANGSYNVGEGYRVGQTLTVGTSTTLIGAFSNVSKNNLSTSTALGAGAVVGCSNCLVLGGTGANAVNVGIGTTSPFAKLSVAGSSYFGGNLTATGTTYLAGNVGIGQKPNSNALDVNGFIAADGSAPITSAPPAQSTNFGWKIGMYTNGGAFGIEPYAFVQGMGSASYWYSLVPTVGANNATASTPDTNAIFSIHGNGDTFIGGKLAVGNTSPQARLDITNSATSSPAIILRDPTGGDSLEIRAGTSTLLNVAVGFEALQSNTTGGFNVALGKSALNDDTTGHNNTANGYLALFANTSGNNSVANGSLALEDNTTGFQNTANGASALSNNTTGSLNVAEGMSALGFNTSATSSTAVGAFAGYGGSRYANQGGVYVGYRAGYEAATSSNYNTLLGYQAGYDLSSGAYNIVLGQNVDLPSNTGSGQLNIGNLLYGTGLYSGGSVSSSSVSGGRVGVGTSTPGSLLSIGSTNGINFSTGTSTFNSTGGIHLTHGCLELPDGGCAISSNNAGVTSVKQSYGTNQTGALTLATSSATANGQTLSLAITNSGSTFTFAPTLTGTLGVAGGGTGNTSYTTNGVLYYNGTKLTNNSALTFNGTTLTTSNDASINGVTVGKGGGDEFGNIALGPSVLSSNTTGNYDVAIAGGTHNTTGSSNTAVGSGSLNYNTSGSGNTALGYDALYGGGVTNLNYDTAVGYKALQYDNQGAYNAAFGYNAGGASSLTFVSTSTTLIGSFSDVGKDNLSTSTALGAGAVVGESNALILGGLGKNSVFAGIGSTSPFARLSIQANPTDSISDKILFAIGSSTASATTTIFSIDNKGNVNAPVSTATTTIAGGLNVGSGALQYDASSGVTSVNSLELGNLNFESDAGVVNWVDMPVTSASATGTIESYTANLDSNPAITVYGRASGSGGITNLAVGIGTTTPGSTLTVSGSACFSEGAGATLLCGTTAGNIYYKTANTGSYDLAEKYTTGSSTLSAGTVVALNPAVSSSTVEAATSSSLVLGVVSSNPGIVLGGADSSSQHLNTVPVALSGRVPVKVSLENGPIETGDRLVLSSTTPGVAAKQITSGYTLGIALAPYTNTTASSTASSTVQMFVDRQYIFVPSELKSLNDIIALASTTTSSTQSQDIFTHIFNGIKTDIAEWLADASNGISDIFAKQVTTDKLCIKDSSGSNVCVTGDQLAALLAGQGAGGESSQGDSSVSGGVSSGATSTASSTNEAPSSAPVIKLNGNNPATVEVGASYNDLGATITGPQADLNLGVKAIVDDGATTTPSKIHLDTSKTGTHTILYVATDQNGLEGTALRTVNVVAKQASGQGAGDVGTSTASSTSDVVNNDPNQSTASSTLATDTTSATTTPAVTTSAASSTPQTASSTSQG